MADTTNQTEDEFDEEFLRVVLQASLDSVDKLVAELGVQGARRHIRSVVMGQLEKDGDDAVGASVAAPTAVTCQYCRNQYAINHDPIAYQNCLYNPPCTPP